MNKDRINLLIEAIEDAHGETEEAIIENDERLTYKKIDTMLALVHEIQKEVQRA